MKNGNQTKRYKLILFKGNYHVANMYSNHYDEIIEIKTNAVFDGYNVQLIELEGETDD